MSFHNFICNRKSFRPAYGKLDLLTSIFSKTPIIGLTATATKATQQKIEETLGLIKPVVIDVNMTAEIFIFHHHVEETRGIADYTKF